MTARRSTPSDKIIPVLPVSSTTRNRSNISYERQDITAWVCTPPVSKSILHLTYWIIAIVPVTVLQNPNGNNAQTNSNPARQASTDVPYHPKYQGTVLFQNKFKGKLPAAEYPKVNVRGMVWPRSLYSLTAFVTVLLRDVLGVHRARPGLGMAMLPEPARSFAHPGIILYAYCRARLTTGSSTISRVS